MEIILWNFLMFYQIFLSPQVKRSTIINNIYGVYELPREFPSDLRLRILMWLSDLMIFRDLWLRLPQGIFADGKAFVPTQEKDLGS